MPATTIFFPIGTSVEVVAAEAVSRRMPIYVSIEGQAAISDAPIEGWHKFGVYERDKERLAAARHPDLRRAA